MASSVASRAAPALSSAEWRQAMGYFPSGVTIVTCWRDGAPVGATVSAICSVSLDPPLLLICLDRSNPLCGPVADCAGFGVNFLGADQADLATRFSQAPEGVRFEGCLLDATEVGPPRLIDAPLFVDCRVESVSQAGDHLIVVGRGVRIDQASGIAPLVYHRGRFPKLLPDA